MMTSLTVWVEIWNTRSHSLFWAAVLGFLLIISGSAMAHGPEIDSGTSSAITASETKSETSTMHHESGLGTPPFDQGSADQSSTHTNGSPHGHGDEMEPPHDHSTHAPSNELLETAVGRLLFWLGKLHPAAVHFPIALLLAAAFAELASLRFKPDFFRDATRFSLWLGAFGAVGAAVLGWLYGGLRIVDDENILTVHRWNGTAIALLAILTLWLAERRARQPSMGAGIYRTVLFATALLVGLNGYGGSVMVYGPDQHRWPAAPSDHAR